MRKIIYLLIPVLFASCNSLFNNDSMKFTLEVENIDLDRMGLNEVVDGENVLVDSIYRKQWMHGNEFEIEKPGKYFLGIDQLRGIPFYMEKGFRLKIFINGVNRFYYEGKGADKNEYLLRQSYHPLIKTEEKIFSAEPKKFIASLNKVSNTFKQLFDKNKTEDEFWKEAKATQFLMKKTALLKYPELYQYYNQKEIVLPSNFYADIAKTNFNDEKFIIADQDVLMDFIWQYGKYLFNKYNKENKTYTKAAQINKTFELIHNYFKNEKLCDKMMYLYSATAINELTSEDINEGISYYVDYSRNKQENEKE